MVHCETFFPGTARHIIPVFFREGRCAEAIPPSVRSLLTCSSLLISYHITPFTIFLPA